MSSSYFPDYQRMDLLDLQAAHLAACDQYEQLVNRQVACTKATAPTRWRSAKPTTRQWPPCSALTTSRR